MTARAHYDALLEREARGELLTAASWRWCASDLMTEAGALPGDRYQALRDRAADAHRRADRIESRAR